MKKKVLWLVLFLLLLSSFAVRFWVRHNLKNPFDEMIYSETELYKVTLFTPLSSVIGSDRHFKSDDDFLTLPYSEGVLDDGERLNVLTTRTGLTFFYGKKIDNQLTLTITLNYDSDLKNINQKVYLSDNVDKKEAIKEPDRIISELEKQGKDLNWLEATSQKVLDDYILGTWFKGGSHRYSLEHLGELKIEYADVLSKN